MAASQASPRGRPDPSPHAALPNIMPCVGGIYPEHLSVTTNISGAALAPPPLKTLAPALFCHCPVTRDGHVASAVGRHRWATREAELLRLLRLLDVTGSLKFIPTHAGTIGSLAALTLPSPTNPPPPSIRPSASASTRQRRASAAPGGRAAASSDLYRLVTKYQQRRRNIGQAKLKH